MLSPFGKTTLYSGKDEQKFFSVCSALKKAGVWHKPSKYDYTARLLHQTFQQPQSPVTFNKHTANMTASLYQMEAMENDSLDSYAIIVRRRDLSRARKCLD